jgi:ABC-2 type transport system ATP-binding protein
MTILTYEAVSKSYGSQPVLSQIDFHLESGSICGLVGANGAGKTTMMRMALGLSHCDSGKISLWLRKNGHIGCLIDTPSFDTSLTVSQNLQAYRILHRYTTEQMREVIDLLSLRSCLEKKIKALSHGMRQKAALALAFMGSPELIILDEPINGLDPQGVREIRETILLLNANYGVTFLISTHIIDELVRVASECALLVDGKITLVEPEVSKIEEAFLGQTQ